MENFVDIFIKEKETNLIINKIGYNLTSTQARNRRRLALHCINHASQFIEVVKK